jgi:LPXTG-site transpeptidase (sortase) family protein
MSDERLLLSPAKIGVLAKRWGKDEYLRGTLTCIGVIVIIVGATDVSFRLAERLPSVRVPAAAFAPGAFLVDSSLQSALEATSTENSLLPVRLRIPSIGVDAHVEHVGDDARGAMANPSTFVNVAWYERGSRPGAPGNAVIAGHLNNALGQDGVFARLSEMGVGEYVTLEDAEGRTLLYQVMRIDTYRAQEAPREEIFKTTGASQLVLITCEGDWLPSQRSYEERLIVFAQLIGA